MGALDRSDWQGALGQARAESARLSPDTIAAIFQLLNENFDSIHKCMVKLEGHSSTAGTPLPRSVILAARNLQHAALMLRSEVLTELRGMQGIHSMEKIEGHEGMAQLIRSEPLRR